MKISDAWVDTFELSCRLAYFDTKIMYMVEVQQGPSFAYLHAKQLKYGSEISLLRGRN